MHLASFIIKFLKPYKLESVRLSIVKEQHYRQTHTDSLRERKCLNHLRITGHKRNKVPHHVHRKIKSILLANEKAILNAIKSLNKY